MMKKEREKQKSDAEKFCFDIENALAVSELPKDIKQQIKNVIRPIILRRIIGGERFNIENLFYDSKESNSKEIVPERPVMSEKENYMESMKPENETPNMQLERHLKFYAKNDKQIADALIKQLHSEQLFFTKKGEKFDRNKER